MHKKTSLFLCFIFSLAICPLLSAQNRVAIQASPTWSQVKGPQQIQSDIRMHGTYKSGSPELIAIVMTKAFESVDYDTARQFVVDTQHGFEIQKLEVSPSSPTHQLGLPGVAVSAFGNQLHNLSICLFTSQEAIQLNFYCSTDISPESPKVQEFIKQVKLSSDVKPADFSDENLSKMAQKQVQPAQVRLYAGIGAIILLAAFLLLRKRR